MPVAPALPAAFLFARRRGPVFLLALPPRPYPRRLPAMLAAIALPRVSRPKAPLASFEQTSPQPRPAHQPFALAALLIFGMACRTLGKAHGRSLLPEAPAPEGNALLSGAQQIFRSVRNQQLYRKDMLAGSRFPFSPPAAGGACPERLLHRRVTRRPWSGRRSYNDLARRNGSRHCRDATIAEG